MEEPSVLDYIKSKIFFWREERINIPAADASVELDMAAAPPPPGSPAPRPPAPLPPASPAPLPPGSGWTLVRVFMTLALAFIAQRALEPPNRSVTTGVIFYLLAAGWLVWSSLRGEWKLAPQPPAEQRTDPLTVRRPGVWICIPLALIAFLMFGGNRFTTANLSVWILAFGAFVYAFWLPYPQRQPWWKRLPDAWSRFREQGITFSPWTLLVLAVFALSAFYRFYQLEQVPAEMFSDHAEKLLDVADVLNGQTRIFFPRNTGREAFQMYLTAAMALIFDTGLSFLSLKLGTALCGLFTLPFIYLLGKEVANRRVGLLAMFFTGIAYWPNVISRVALRFTLYPFFVAPALYFLVRGLRRRNRNDFILAGIALGLGLHGYNPYRFVPIVVVAVVGLYLLHRQSQGARTQTVWGLALLALTSLMVFLPLLRYWISEPEIFSYRALTRISSLERPLPGPALEIFFENLWHALVMPFWDNGEIWVHSIPHRPALGIVAAVFLFVGVLLLAVRYMRQRNWLDIFLLVSIPLLMMPSVLSLAFPSENPSLNRTGGAMILIFLIVGMGLDGLLTTLQSRSLFPGGTWLAWGLAATLLVWSAAQNYDLVFRQYHEQFQQSAWNTSELGAVIRQFADSAGAEDSAWVVPYPHWVDTRLVGIRAGFPGRDYALWADDLIDTVEDPRTKLFLFKPEDTEALGILRDLYPAGSLRLYNSAMDSRDFYMYFVPPAER
ncbi:MAG: glycosyltransferase family 39 protein [Chloroflexi bacterium]|nr:glycosyltransferase family 39 protein [Chloroflexota bacterium]